MFLKLAQDGCSELQALSLDFPVLLIGERRNLLADFEHGLGVLLGNCAHHVDGVDADVDSLV